jgi:hypothetical protein
MSIDHNKICPYCAESIRAAAKVCPHCRQPLTFRSMRHPVTAFLVMLVPMLACVVFIATGVVYKLDKILNPGPHYGELLSSLSVTESHMNHVQATNEQHIYLYGLITNRSEVAWQRVEFDCRFFDKNGALIDAQTGLSPWVVQPHDEAAFRVGINPSRPVGDYDSYKISVVWARNANGIF